MAGKIILKKGPGMELYENSPRKLWNGFQFNKSIFDSLFLWLLVHSYFSFIQVYSNGIKWGKLNFIQSNIESKIQQKMKEFLPSIFIFSSLFSGLTDLPGFRKNNFPIFYQSYYRKNIFCLDNKFYVGIEIADEWAW